MPASFFSNLIGEKREYSSYSKMVQQSIQQKIQWVLYVTFLATTLLTDHCL
jgi:methionine salvage enolase-phosphatase E1